MSAPITRSCRPRRWRGVYRDAWARYYSDAHVETVLRRAVASGISPKKIVDAMTVFSGSSRIEGVHPLQFGYVRRKIRTQRRHGLPVVNPLVFYPWRAWDFVESRREMAGARACATGRSTAASSPTRRRGLRRRGAAPVDRGGSQRRFRRRLRRQDPRHLRRAEARESAPRQSEPQRRLLRAGKVGVAMQPSANGLAGQGERADMIDPRCREPGICRNERPPPGARPARHAGLRRPRRLRGPQHADRASRQDRALGAVRLARQGSAGADVRRHDLPPLLDDEADRLRGPHDAARGGALHAL